MLTVDIHRGDRTARIVLAGELDLGTEDQVRDAIAGALPADRIEVDMAGLSYCDSTGVNLLVTAQTRLRTAGTVLFISNPRGMVTSVLQVSGVMSILSDPH